MYLFMAFQELNVSLFVVSCGERMMFLHNRLRWFLTAASILAITSSVIYTYDRFLPAWAVTPASRTLNVEKAKVTAAVSSPTGKPSSGPGAHSRLLVIARKKDEDVSWIKKQLGDLPDFETAIYIVDRPEAPFRVPRNKGHEVMVYLTYMIDNYDSLRDVTMFMHAHLSSWHNNDLLRDNAALMVRRLSTDRVIREGYMNMRCHWDPGCPHHLHPLSKEAINNTQQPEEAVFANAWRELFHNISVPTVLSQPCCGQFALSRAKIRSIPRERYVYFRDWLLRTELPDKLSGRVWEYIWQYLFASVAEFCPKEHICYCDGYGVCFGGENEYRHYFDQRSKKQEYEQERDKLKKKEGEGQKETIDIMASKIFSIELELHALRENALAKGMDPQFRAQEVGRKWSPGDGF